MAVSSAPPRDPFSLTEEERTVRDTVRAFAAARLAPTAAQRDEEERFDRSLFTGMAEIGLAGLPYPERYGGAGMGSFPWASRSRRSPPRTWGWRCRSASTSSPSSHPLLRDR